MVMESSSVVFLSTKAPSNATSPTHALWLPPTTGMTTNKLQAPRTLGHHLRIGVAPHRGSPKVPAPPLLFADGIQRARRKQHGGDSARRTINATSRDLSPSAATQSSTPPAGLVNGAHGAETTHAYR
ncbi:hypothetical protein K438DRAFT_1927387 [Mycena galopus ATCC 62051]|nr:hypothetical protein K438DRAFT_1927387 [Mycena galopus ATCC 62051]